MIYCENCNSNNVTINNEKIFFWIYYCCNDCKFPGVVPNDNILYRKVKIEKIKQRCIT